MFDGRVYVIIGDDNFGLCPGGPDSSVADLDTYKEFIAVRQLHEGKPRYFLICTQPKSCQELSEIDLQKRWLSLSGRELNLCDVLFYETYSLR
jgi:hypothetical protein